jgi:hypothetical protein
VRDPAMLFGREHELHEIAAFIQGTQSVSLVGPRKIGKTSLLLQLMRPMAWPELGIGPENLFVYVDCEVLGEGSHTEIFGLLAAEVAAALDERNLLPEPALEKAQGAPTRLALEAALRKLNQRGLRVVLVLDEFERLATNAHLDVTFFNTLRSIAGRYQVVYLTASAHPLIELTFSGRSQEILSSPFFNIFAPVFLGLLDAPASYRLIREPSARAGTPFTAATQQLLYELVGGHPFALQVTCFHAFDAQHDHAEAERRTLRELHAHFQYTWHNLFPNEQEALRDIAHLGSRAAGDTTLRGVLRDLVQKCLLVAEGHSYRYPSRAWAAFVAAQAGQPSGVRTVMLTQVREGQRATGGLAKGSLLGPYEVQERLGRGGMSEVYLGRHTRLNRAVAIKVLAASLAEHADFRARFEREARAVAALSHPNIVQVYDFGDAGGHYYMILEYIDGSDLARHLAPGVPLSLAEVRPLMGDIAAALDYAHAQGVIHRDIKPSNIMLRRSARPGGVLGQAVLTDFGIAKVLTGSNAQLTRAGAMVGTPNYMAPEQIWAADSLDARADIYALGVVLFQMLAGRLPFTGASVSEVVHAHLHQPPPDLRDVDSTLAPQIAQVIQRALAKQPNDRPATAGELVEALVEP